MCVKCDQSDCAQEKLFRGRYYGVKEIRISEFKNLG